MEDRQVPNEFIAEADCPGCKWHKEYLVKKEEWEVGIKKWMDTVGYHHYLESPKCQTPFDALTIKIDPQKVFSSLFKKGHA